MTRHEPFAQGYLAETRGKTAAHNPYRRGRARRDWATGWRQSRRETFNLGKGAKYAGPHDYAPKSPAFCPTQDDMR